jgi:hypothetical protein
MSCIIKNIPESLIKFSRYGNPGTEFPTRSSDNANVCYLAMEQNEVTPIYTENGDEIFIACPDTVDASTTTNFNRIVKQQFIPTDLTKLRLWLDASDPTAVSFTTNTTNVSAWLDKSSNGYHATQTSFASQPVYINSAVNNLNAIMFDGNGDFFNLIANALPEANPVTRFSIFVVAVPEILGRDTTNGGAGILRKDLGFNTENSWGIGIRSTGSLTFRQVVRVTTFFGPQFQRWLYASSNLVTNLTPRILRYVYDSCSSSKVQLGVDYNTNFFEPSVNTNSWPTGNCIIGADNVNSNTYFKNYLCEILVYDRIFDDYTAGQIETYLSSKWNVPLFPYTV